MKTSETADFMGLLLGPLPERNEALGASPAPRGENPHLTGGPDSAQMLDEISWFPCWGGARSPPSLPLWVVLWLSSL